MTVDPLSRFAKRSEDDEFWTEVESHLGPVERRITEAFRQSLANAKENADIDRIMELIKVGDYDRAVDLMLGANSADASVFMVVRSAVDQAAVSYMAMLASGKIAIPLPRITVQIDTLQEPTLHAIRHETMQTVTEINTATRKGLKVVLENGMIQGNNPRVIAKDMRDMVGLTDRDAQAVLNYRAKLEMGSLAALRYKLRNRRHDGFVRRGELDAKRIDDMVSDFEQRLIKHRAETIARTEAARAFTLGQQELWKQVMRAQGVESRFVRRYWAVSPDERHASVCEWCIATAALNEKGVGMDEPFQTPDGPVFLPPGHPLCRCTIKVKFDLEGQVRSMANQPR